MATDLIYGRLDKDGGEECPWIEQTCARYESEVWHWVCSITFPLQVDIKKREKDSCEGEEAGEWWH